MLKQKYLFELNDEDVYAFYGEGKDYRVSIRYENQCRIAAVWSDNIGEWKDILTCDFNEYNDTQFLNLVNTLLTPMN